VATPVVCEVAVAIAVTVKLIVLTGGTSGLVSILVDASGNPGPGGLPTPTSFAQAGASALMNIAPINQA
jgi:hypothetical protein